MQGDYNLKKFHFNLKSPPPGLGGGDFEQNICYHVAAFLIPFHLIFNMTMVWKSWILTPGSEGRGEGFLQVFFATMLLHSWFPLIWYATWPCSEKAEFRPFDPQGWGKRASAGKIFECYLTNKRQKTDWKEFPFCCRDHAQGVGVGDAGGWGGQKFSVGICHGAPSTVHSSH